MRSYLVFIFLFIGITNLISQETRQVLPTKEKLFPKSNQTTLMFVFNETSYKTCINKQFYWPSYGDPTEPGSLRNQLVIAAELYDEATFPDRIYYDNYSNFNGFTALSPEELFTDNDWNNLTTEKVFWILICVRTHEQNSISVSSGYPTSYYPYAHWCLIKRTFYPKTKAGNVFFNLSTVTSKTVEYNTNPGQINGNSATGGNNSFSYQWQQKIFGSTLWSDIYSATSEGYYPGVLNTTMYYRRKDISQSCGNTLYSNEVSIIVLPNVNGGQIGTTQNICYGQNLTLQNIQSASGGTGIYNYQWERSEDGGSWQSIAGATGESYNLVNPTTTYNYRRSCVSGVNSAISNSVKITVYDNLTSGVISPSQTICHGSTPSQLGGTSPTGGDGSYSYKWESSTNGSLWNEIPLASSASYQPGTLNVTTYYRRIVTSGSNCGSRTGNTVTITVYDNLTSGIISPSDTICNGATPQQLIGTSPSGGDGTYNYKWEYSTNSTSWNEIPLATSASYQPGALILTTYYRRIATSGSNCGTRTSNIVTVTVQGSLYSGVIQPSQTICFGIAPSKLTGTAAYGPKGLYLYQWKYSEDGNTFNNVAGANSLDYQPGILTKTTYFKRIVTTICGTGETNILSIVVHSELEPGIITNSHSICYYSTPSLITGTLPSGGDGSYSYKWESSTNGTSWNEVPLATSANYQPGALKVTTNYHRIVTSGSNCGTRTSNIVTVTVYDKINSGTIYKSQSICNNSTPERLTGTTASGGDNSYFYQWKYSGDGNIWNSIPGAINVDYQPDKLKNSTYYKRLVTTGCGSTYTDSVIIEVKPDIIAGTISKDQTICFNNIPDQLTGTYPTGGFNSYHFNWEWSSDNINWSSISNTNTQNYQPRNLLSSTYFRRMVTDNKCGNYYTNSISIVTRPKLPTPTVFYRPFYCEGAKVSLQAGNTYIYNWYDTNNNLLRTGPNFEINNLIENQEIYVKAQNNSNCVSDSQRINLIVDKVVADFNYNSTNVKEAQPIKFVNQSINAINFIWDFSEGEKSYIKDPWHIFNDAGNKTVKLIAISEKQCSDTTIKNDLVIEPTVGIEKVKNISYLVYPNPVKTILTIDFDDYLYEIKLKLYNSNGCLLFHTNGYNLFKIDLSQFPAGIYILSIEGNKVAEKVKIIKK